MALASRPPPRLAFWASAPVAARWWRRGRRPYRRLAAMTPHEPAVGSNNWSRTFANWSRKGRRSPRRSSKAAQAWAAPMDPRVPATAPDTRAGAASLASGTGYKVAAASPWPPSGTGGPDQSQQQKVVQDYLDLVNSRPLGPPAAHPGVVAPGCRAWSPPRLQPGPRAGRHGGAARRPARASRRSAVRRRWPARCAGRTA